MIKKFEAFEYTKDDEFVVSEYEFDGDETTGWSISRNGEHYLNLDKGYKLLKTQVCGICSTDIDRRFLPFPLPQITGHEIIAEDEKQGMSFAVEINDTDMARNSAAPDVFCTSGIPTHSPDRMVLGIDRLPGGFGPYILAPVNAMIPIGNLSHKTAVLIEPFAAALNAVTASPPKDGSTVAVLGPRRLGSLVLSALNAYRNSNGKKFEIVSLVRHDHLIDLSLSLGADKAIHLKKVSPEQLSNQFDIVYDTTSTPSGFETALNLAKEEIHLKTTNGQEMAGVQKLTEFVVDELSILPYSQENLDFTWPNEKRNNEICYVSPSLTEKVQLNQNQKGFSPQSKEEVASIFQSNVFKNRVPRFDIAIVSNEKELEFAIRPFSDSEQSLVRPRGGILVYPNLQSDNNLIKFISSGKRIRSSRCGDFHKAIQLLEQNPAIAENLSKYMISHEFSIQDLETAFATAKQSNSVKVMVKH